MAFETPPVALGAISVGVWGNCVKKACQTTGRPLLEQLVEQQHQRHGRDAERDGAERRP